MYSKCTDCRIKYNTKYIGMVTLMIDSHSVLILYQSVTFIEYIISMLPTKFHSFREAVLEEKIWVEIDQSETRITCGCHFYKRIGMK